jgi:hypothetical protein
MFLVEKKRTEFVIVLAPQGLHGNRLTLEE